MKFLRQDIRSNLSQGRSHRRALIQTSFRDTLGFPMTVSRFIPSLLLATSAFAQPALKFEVATIKPAPPDAALNRVVQVDPSRISFQMTRLRERLRGGYDLHRKRLRRSDW